MIGWLRQAGILGINRRNVDYVQAWNPRHAFPDVDDKVRTKGLMEAAGLPCPKTIGVVSQLYELRRLPELLRNQPSFVVKPARGSQGNGILVAKERSGDGWKKASGDPIAVDDVHFRVAEILSGLFSLGGQADKAIIEECLVVHPALDRISHGGVPDLRVVLYRGLPAMAMLRLPTRASDGRANLHQGAVGVGIDLETGRSTRAIMHGRPVRRHPDTDQDLIDVEVPDFQAALARAVDIAATSRLGYIGVDLVVDEHRGPVVLELNARPGLAIQTANRHGLVPVLAFIDRMFEDFDDPAERLARVRAFARSEASRRAGEST